MSSDRPFKNNKIFTEEMVLAAGARIRAYLASNPTPPSMETAARDNVANQVNPIEEIEVSDIDSDSDFEEDFEEDAEDIEDLLPFTLAEQDLIDQLGATVRQRMTSADPETLRKIATFLYALERLPYVTPEVMLDLAISERIGENLSYVSVDLTGQTFRLSAGGSVYSPDVGSDSYSHTTFQIEAGGFRDGSTLDFVDWLEAFTSTGGSVVVDGDCDVDLSEPAPDDGWDRLSTYWETCGEDDCDW